MSVDKRKFVKLVVEFLQSKTVAPVPFKFLMIGFLIYLFSDKKNIKRKRVNEKITCGILKGNSRCSSSVFSGVLPIVM